MAIVFMCPRCDRKYSVSDALAGRRATCKDCGQEQTVPSPRPTPRPSSGVLTDFEEEDDEPVARKPYAQDFDDVPIAPPPRSVAPARVKPSRPKRPAQRSSLADLNLGSWIGGYFGINAVAFLISIALLMSGQVDRAQIMYYTVPRKSLPDG